MRALEAARDTAQIKLPRTKLRAAVNGGADTLRPVLQQLVDAATMTTNEVDGPTKPPTLVISIDQGEELFRAEGQDEAERLLALLGGLLGDAAPSLIVVIAIRSDSYAQLQEAKALEGLQKIPFDLGPMPHGSYAGVIKGPATRLEESTRPLRIDDALVDVLLEDIEAGGSKDALPLLSFTMERLYLENLGSGGLTLTDYRNLGGIKGSIEEAVEQALSADTDPPLPKNRTTRLALLRRGMIPWLANIDPDTGAPRRRVARYSEIPADCRPLLQSLVDQRLLTTDRVGRTGEITIEPAHEALLRQWSLLEDWLTEDAELLAVLEGVKRASLEWRKSNKSRAWLIHAADRLAAAEQLSARTDLAASLEEPDREYLAACRTAENERLAAEKRQREAELEATKKIAAAESHRASEAQAHAAVLRKRSRVLRAVLACTVIVAVVAVIGFFRAHEQKRLAQGNAQEAVARKLVSEALAILAGANTAGDDARAFQELLAAQKLSTKLSDEPLLDALVNRSSTELILNGTTPVVGVAFADGGQRLAVADYKSVRVWDTRSKTWWEDLRTSDPAGETKADLLGCHRPHCFPLSAGEKALTNVAISADGQVVAAGNVDGKVLVWNLNDAQPIPKSLPQPHQGRVSGIALSRDGHWLASVGADGFIDISRSDGTDMHKPIGIRGGGALFTVAFNRAADKFAVGGADGAIRVWNVGTVPPEGGPVEPNATNPNAHPGGVTSITFSPDDRLVASGGADNLVRLWNSEKLSPAGQLPALGAVGHAAPVTSVAFSADGTRLVSGGNDKTVQLWDVAGKRRIGDPLIGHQGWVLCVAIVGDQIVSGGNENALRFWNAAVGQPLKEPLDGHGGPVTSVAIGPDSRQVVSGDVDGTVRLWDAYTGTEINRMPDSARVITRVAFNRSGDVVASGSADGKIRLWNLTTGAVRAIETGQPITAVAMGPDGNLLASAGIDGQITIWELSSGRPNRLENNDNSIISDLAFSPQGDRLASGSVAGMVRVWDLSGRQVWHADATAGAPKPFSDRPALAIEHQGAVLGVAFSPDGRRLVSGSTAVAKDSSTVGVIERWDVHTGAPMGDPAEIPHAVMGLAFSPGPAEPTQDRIVGGSFIPFTVQLLSAANGSQYTFTGHQAQVVSIAVSPDGALIASGSVDGTVRIWPNPPMSSPADALCAKLTTTMSQEHWKKWVSPHIPYRQVCPGLPPTPDEMPS
ncbi:hypothetical protein GCM10023161_18930 [Mycobacterium paraffinicum]|uniref:Novel STAND NTPase 1 domain-containing protein n=2 Tax=Mycobacterium paraffinicum TaxID=53378 RepID=A0ABP8RIZ6_9MYCO